MSALDTLKNSLNNTTGTTKNSSSLNTLKNSLNNKQTSSTANSSINVLKNSLSNPVNLNLTGLDSATETLKNNLPEQNTSSIFHNSEDASEMNSLLDVINSGVYSILNNKNVFTQALSEYWNNIKKPFTQAGVPLSTRFLAFGLNTLTAVGEDLDILANYAKAIAPTSWTTGKEYSELTDTAAKLGGAFGTIDQYGNFKRYSFDADTGNFLTNMALEMVSDPLNVISWAKSGVTALTATADSSIKIFIKNLPDDIVDTVVSKFNVQDFIKNSNVVDIARSMNLTDPKTFPDEMLKAIEKVAENNKKEVDDIVKGLAKDGIKKVIQLDTGDIVKSKMGGVSKLFKKVFLDFGNDKKIIASLADGMRKNPEEAKKIFIDAFVAKASFQAIDDPFVKALQNYPDFLREIAGNYYDALLKSAEASSSLSLLKGVRTLGDVAEKADDIITKGSFGFITGPYALLKKTKLPSRIAFNLTKTKTARSIARFITNTSNGVLDPFRIITADGTDLGLKLYTVADARKVLDDHFKVLKNTGVISDAEETLLKQEGASLNTDEIITALVNKSIFTQTTLLEDRLKDYTKSITPDNLIDKLEQAKLYVADFMINTGASKDSPKTIESFLEYLKSEIISKNSKVVLSYSVQSELNVLASLENCIKDLEIDNGEVAAIRKQYKEVNIEITNTLKKIKKASEAPNIIKHSEHITSRNRYAVDLSNPALLEDMQSNNVNVSDPVAVTMYLRKKFGGNYDIEILDPTSGDIIDIYTDSREFMKYKAGQNDNQFYDIKVEISDKLSRKTKATLNAYEDSGAIVTKIDNKPYIFKGKNLQYNLVPNNNAKAYYSNAIKALLKDPTLLTEQKEKGIRSLLKQLIEEVYYQDLNIVNLKEISDSLTSSKVIALFEDLKPILARSENTMRMKDKYYITGICDLNQFNELTERYIALVNDYIENNNSKTKILYNKLIKNIEDGFSIEESVDNAIKYSNSIIIKANEETLRDITTLYSGISQTLDPYINAITYAYASSADKIALYNSLQGVVATYSEVSNIMDKIILAKHRDNSSIVTFGIDKETTLKDLFKNKNIETSIKASTNQIKLDIEESKEYLLILKDLNILSKESFVPMLSLIQGMLDDINIVFTDLKRSPEKMTYGVFLKYINDIDINYNELLDKIQYELRASSVIESAYYDPALSVVKKYNTSSDKYKSIDINTGKETSSALPVQYKYVTAQDYKSAFDQLHTEDEKYEMLSKLIDDQKELNKAINENEKSLRRYKFHIKPNSELYSINVHNLYKSGVNKQKYYKQKYKEINDFLDQITNDSSLIDMQTNTNKFADLIKNKTSFDPETYKALKELVKERDKLDSQIKNIKIRYHQKYDGINKLNLREHKDYARYSKELTDAKNKKHLIEMQISEVLSDDNQRMYWKAIFGSDTPESTFSSLSVPSKVKSYYEAKFEHLDDSFKAEKATDEGLIALYENKVLRKAQNNIYNLKKEFTKYNAFDVDNTYVKARAEQSTFTHYVLNCESTYRLNNLLVNESTREYQLLQNIINSKGIQKQTEIATLAESITNKIKLYAVYKEFFSQCSLYLDSGTYMSLLESIENYGRITLDDLLSADFRYALKSSMNLNYATSHTIRRNSLDTFRREISTDKSLKDAILELFDGDEAKLNRALLYAHDDPGADTLTTYAYFRSNIEKADIIEEGRKGCTFDIETTNTSKYYPSKSSAVLMNSNKNTVVISQISVMDNITKQPIVIRLKGLPYPTGASNKQIIEVSSEKQLLKRFNKLIKDGQYNLFLGMNSAQFDIPAIRNVWRRVDPEGFENSVFNIANANGIKFVDAYKEFMIQNGSKIPIDYIKEGETIDRLLELLPEIFKRFNASTDTVFDLSPQHTYQDAIRLIKQIKGAEAKHNPSLQKDINELIEILNTSGEMKGTKIIYTKDLQSILEDTVDNVRSLSNKGMNNVWLRDYTKDPINEVTLNELEKLSKNTSIDYFIKKSGITLEEYNTLKRGLIDTKGLKGKKLTEAMDSNAEYNRIRNLVEEAYINQRFFYGYGDMDESIDDFLNKFGVGYNSDEKQIRNFSDFINPDHNGSLNFKYMWDPSKFNYKGLNGFKLYNLTDLQKTYITDQLSENLQNSAKKINRLYFERIKNPDAIIGDLGLFSDLDQLKLNTIGLLQNYKKLNLESSWINYLNLQEIMNTNDSNLIFAVFYTVFSDASAVASKNLLSGSSALTKELYDLFSELDFNPKLSIFEDIKDYNSLTGMFDIPVENIRSLVLRGDRTSAFAVNDYRDRITQAVLKKAKYSFEEIDFSDTVEFDPDDIFGFNRSSYDVLINKIQDVDTAMTRLSKMKYFTDTIGKGGAKENMANLAANHAFGNIAKDISNLKYKDKIDYGISFGKMYTEAKSMDTLMFLKDCADDPKYLVSNMLFNDGILVLTFNGTSKSDYNNSIINLLSKRSELEALGVDIVSTGENPYICPVVLALKKEGANLNVNSNKTIIKYFGNEYQIPNSTPIRFITDNEHVGQHLYEYNQILKHNAYEFNGRAFGTHMGYDGFKSNLERYLPNDTTHLSLDDFESIGFFGRNSLRKTLIYDTVDVKPNDAMTKFFNDYMYTIHTENSEKLFFDSLLDPRCNITLNNTNGIFKGCSYQEISDAFRDNDDFIAIVPVADENTIQGWHIKRLSLDTAEQVQFAAEQNAVVVPYQVYSKCFEDINLSMEANYKAPIPGSEAETLLREQGILAYAKTQPKYYLKLFNQIYKVGALLSPGTWMRNFIDSNFKAAIDTGAPIETGVNTLRASKLMQQYSDTIKDISHIYERPKELNLTAIKEAYKRFKETNHTPAIDQETFLFLHNFIINGPSAGEARALTNWYTEAAKKAGDYTYGLMDISGILLRPMSWVEETARLGEYLTLCGQGFTKTEAFTKISHTAFNYSLKSKATNMVEYFIPFFNFKRLNALYWLDTLDKCPGAIRFLDDFRKSAWKTFDVDPEEYDSNLSSVYHMLNGNINISGAFGFTGEDSSDLVLKLSPSYMDAANIILDPINSFSSSLRSSLNNFVDYTMDTIEDRETQKSLEDGTYVITFGKYKGQSLNEMMKDVGYVQTLLGQDWLMNYKPNVYTEMMKRMAGTDLIIPFNGKFAGQKVSVLLEKENIGYAQWLITQQWFHDLYKPVYDYLIMNNINNNPVMPFGKYKGTELSKLPSYYKDYLLRQDWLYSDWGYIADELVENRNYVLKTEDIDYDVRETQATLAGKLAAGMFKPEEEGMTYLQGVFENVFKNHTSYPVIGPIFQRYFKGATKKDEFSSANASDYSSSIKNNQRMKNKNQFARALGTWVPDIFASTAAYERMKLEEDIDYSKIPEYTSKYTAGEYIAKNPKRNYNYYRKATSSRFQSAYRRYRKRTNDVAQLHLNIAQLHLI